MMFSVVMCTYNRADRIGRAINGVLAQSFDDFELIVVNDGSTDETSAVVREYGDTRVRLLERANGGLSAARNSGIAQAGGRFVIALDDDDEVSEHWLAGLAEPVDHGTGFVSCTARFVSEDRTTTETLEARPNVLYPEILGVFMAGTFAIEREVLNAIGGYAEAIAVSHQSELLLRALPEVRRRGLTAAFVDEPLIDIERREPGARPLSQPHELLEGAEYLIDHHGPLLAGKPRALANYHAIAGVSAAQLGQYRTARRHLARAAKKAPAEPKHLFRLVLSMVPPVARRAWRPVA